MRNVILVGVDGSSNSDRGLEWAIVEANIRNWPLRLVSAFPTASVADPVVGASYALAARREAKAILDHATKRAEARSVRTEAHVECGDATKVLVEHSETAKLAVVGKRGRGGFVGRLLGSVSSGLAASSHCPTVVIPQEGHESAINGLSFAGQIVMAVDSGLQGPRAHLMGSRGNGAHPR